MTGMILIPNPAKIGLAIEDIRIMLGLGRRDLARAVAKATGRNENYVNSQICSWLHRSPNPASLAPVLVELGYDLAPVPREDA